MKKVGLAVVTYKDNFGSALQTFATQDTVQNLGFETGIFDISGVHGSINRRKIRFYLKRIFYKDEFKYLWDSLVSRSKVKMNIASDAYTANMVIRHKEYEKFNNKYLKFLPTMKSWDELTNQSKECDFVVVGSDQLWRPSNIAGGYFTLDFVPNNVKKIAFATSFGVSVMPKILHKTIKRFVSRIDCVSVREEAGKKIAKDIAGRDVPVLCDPSMLLNAEQWMKIQVEQPIVSGEYILCYLLGDNPQHREFAKRLKQKTGYKIVALLHGSVYIPSDDLFADETPFDIGPGDFINLIRYSKYMCTDSFHGAIFSILNSKRFFAFRRYSDDSEFSTNDRINTLLDWTGLSNRLIYGNENVEDLMNQDIDYSKILPLVEKKRNEALEYLKKSLDVGK